MTILFQKLHNLQGITKISRRVKKKKEKKIRVSVRICEIVRMSGALDAKDSVQLVFVGSPLLDISAECCQDVLDRFGLNQDDCVRAGAEHDPLFRTLFDNAESRLSAGGSAQNAARIAKWVLRDKGQVSFAGCTGRDDYEAWMRNKLSSEGVLPLYVEIPRENTGVCACLLNADEKRSMCARLGAGALFSPEHLDLESVRHHLQRAHCIFVEGYFLAHSPDAVFALAELCRPDKVFSLSLSAEYVCQLHCEALRKVVLEVDVLFGNEAEVKAFARAMGGNDEITVEESIRMIRQLPRSSTAQPQVVIITCGSDPVVVNDGSNDFLRFDVPKDVQVEDSVGCGDALAGAFLATYLQTRDVASAMQVGIRAAVEILQVTGCDPPWSKSV